MGAIVDVAYLAGLTVAAPVLLPRLISRGKHRIDWGARLGKGEALPTKGCPRVLLGRADHTPKLRALRTHATRAQAA